MYVLSDDSKEKSKVIESFIDKYLEQIEESEPGIGKFTEKVLYKFSKAGFANMVLEEHLTFAENDVIDVNFIDMINVIYKLAYSDAATAHFLATINFCFYLPLKLFGSKVFADECAKENKYGILAFTEEQNKVSTIAKKADDEEDVYILNGKKHLIAGADIVDYVLVNALVDGKHTIFNIDLKHTEGVLLKEINLGMGMQSLRMWQIEFYDVKISEQNVIGGVGNGFVVIAKCMEAMRIANAALALGIAKRAFDESVAYCKQRMVGNEHLYDMQYIRYEMADVKANLELLEIDVFYTAELYRKGVDSQFIKSSITKYIVTEKAKEICDRMFQLFGGNGFIKGNIMERLYRDIRITTIAGGASESLKDIISRLI